MFKQRWNLFDWIILFLGCVLIFVVYHHWMLDWISIGTLSDILIRRCLFVFVVAAISGMQVAFKKHKTEVDKWFMSNAWLSGLLWGVIIECYRLFKLSYILHVSSFSEVIHSWISQWWIIGIVILLGISGRYCGQLLGQKWQIKRRERKETNKRSDVAHI
ncbi:MAG: hypothetical protein WBB37_05280 [bacterium]